MFVLRVWTYVFRHLDGTLFSFERVDGSKTINETLTLYVFRCVIEFPLRVVVLQFLHNLSTSGRIELHIGFNSMGQ